MQNGKIASPALLPPWFSAPTVLPVSTEPQFSSTGAGGAGDGGNNGGGGGKASVDATGGKASVDAPPVHVTSTT
eukprot:158246-Pleurochrysis_carterae.AAC.2